MRRTIRSLSRAKSRGSIKAIEQVARGLYLVTDTSGRVWQVYASDAWEAGDRVKYGS